MSIFLPFHNFWILESAFALFGRKVGFANVPNSHDTVAQNMTQKLHVVPKPFCFGLPGIYSHGIPLHLLNSEEVAAGQSAAPA